MALTGKEDMIFNHHNVMPLVRIVDMDSGLTLSKVESINVDSGEVKSYPQPLRFTHLGGIALESRQYRSIYPIYGGELYPVMFHCYGLQ